jgi:hypothetical protein
MSVFKYHAFIFLDQPPPWRYGTLMPWDEGPGYLPTNRKPSTTGTGFQKNWEKWWPYKIFTIIFWAVQSHQKYMEIISVLSFAFFVQNLQKISELCPGIIPRPYMMQLQRAGRARSNRRDAVERKNYFTFFKWQHFHCTPSIRSYISLLFWLLLQYN